MSPDAYKVTKTLQGQKSGTINFLVHIGHSIDMGTPNHTFKLFLKPICL